MPYGVNYGDENARFCYIDWIYTKKGHRRQGLATQLYRETEKRCQKEGIKTVMLDVFTINKIFRLFHNKNSYQPLVTIYQKSVGQTRTSGRKTSNNK